MVLPHASKVEINQKIIESCQAIMKKKIVFKFMSKYSVKIWHNNKIKKMFAII
jgi:hypothetical protein